MIGAVNRVCDETDLALTAAGGFPENFVKTGKPNPLERLTVNSAFPAWAMKSPEAGGRKWQTQTVM